MGTHFESVQRDRWPEVLAALNKAGFDFAPAEDSQFLDQHWLCRLRCRRDGRDVFLGASAIRDEYPDEVWVTTAIPPYSLWPWRWRGDRRFFEAVKGVLDGFHYLDMGIPQSQEETQPR